MEMWAVVGVIKSGFEINMHMGGCAKLKSHFATGHHATWSMFY